MKKCDDQINQVFFIFNTWELLSEHKRLKSLELIGTYQREPHTRPPSCITPPQPTIYDQKITTGKLHIIQALF